MGRQETKPAPRVTGQRRALRLDQRGVSGLETTIILIAFVTLASVFGFAVLTTGILTSERSRETVTRGLEVTSGTLTLKGTVVGVANADLTAIDSVKFELTNALHGSGGVNLSGESVVITYIDADQAKRINTGDWTATWLTGFGSLLNTGERVEVIVDLQGLDPTLGPSRKFTIQMSPGTGPGLNINKTTPAELTKFFDLP